MIPVFPFWFTNSNILNFFGAVYVMSVNLTNLTTYYYTRYLYTIAGDLQLPFPSSGFGFHVSIGAAFEGPQRFLRAPSHTVFWFSVVCAVSVGADIEGGTPVAYDYLKHN
jgi:hypothetical protein